MTRGQYALASLLRSRAIAAGQARPGHVRIFVRGESPVEFSLGIRGLNRHTLEDDSIPDNGRICYDAISSAR